MDQTEADKLVKGFKNHKKKVDIILEQPPNGLKQLLLQLRPNYQYSCAIELCMHLQNTVCATIMKLSEEIVPEHNIMQMMLVTEFYDNLFTISSGEPNKKTQVVCVADSQTMNFI